MNRVLDAPRSTVLTIPPSQQGLERAAGAYLAFASRYSLTDDVRADMYVALEEIASNVVRHGTGVRAMTITFTIDRTTLRIDVADDGDPFDPFSAPAPDVTQAIEERPLGGLGVFLVKQLTTSLRRLSADGGV
jgi:anti-sigma regulatory factor (Ser/Thr protein kinase)